ncbi:MAG: hypothetical protein M0T80_15245 [Actinomycetota bacterium]|nr:hypothetical protein [Actinomycetota bacterium]
MTNPVGMTKRRRRAIILVASADLLAGALAWRDLSQRQPAALRGPKVLWRALILANPGNSVLYWTIGRRRASG